MLLYISTKKKMKGLEINTDMDIDYNKEYKNILNNIKYQLERLSLPETTKRKFLMYVKVIEQYNKSDELSYQKAIVNLLHIQKELEKYMYKILIDMHNLIENTKDKDNFLKEEQESLTELRLSDIKNNLTVSLSKLKDTNIKIKKIKTKIITYISILSLLLTLTGHTLIKLKNNSKETVYQTRKETYTTIDGSINYRWEYLPKEEEDCLIIRKCKPWIIEGNECRREVVTYNVSGLIFENLVNNNIEKVLMNFEGTTSHEYKYKKDLTKKDKYVNIIYEVIRTTQNKENSIEVSKNFGEIFPLLISLFGELFLYMSILGLNDGSLVASILFEIDKLIQNKELSKEQINLLKKYAQEFENLVKDNSISQKTLKRVNKISYEKSN